MRVLDWTTLSTAERRAALERPAQRGAARIAREAAEIVAAVRLGGDAALLDLTERFDGVRLGSLEASDADFEAAARTLSAAQHRALEVAIGTVRTFHAAQSREPLSIDTAPGVRCERRSVPVRAVGLYVPAGSAPLPSTAIMLAVPAAIAGCRQRVMCTAPDRRGAADPAVLVAARKAGVQRVFKVGGAQAIAAMAYGTASIPKCDKLYGPGNAWVTAAKLCVASDPAGAAADLPAGVTEVMVVADESARADFVAADLLAQAEHGAEAQAILVTPVRALVAAVEREIRTQAQQLSRRDILESSVREMRLIIVDSLDGALDIANEYAPEHLILQVRDARRWLAEVESAGAVFLGAWSPETMGDYCSGPNHTLPTYGYARAYSGLSLEDFQKRITVQELTPAGLAALSGTACTLAALEGLDAHAAAVNIRMAALAGYAA
jgi:histidinol dehydrogenase